MTRTFTLFHSVHGLSWSLDVRVPCLSFGVYQIEGEECTAACQAALEAGYRLINTAQLYRNEERVGAAILSSRLPRHDIFITTKQGVRVTSFSSMFLTSVGVPRGEKKSGRHWNNYMRKGLHAQLGSATSPSVVIRRTYLSKFTQTDGLEAPAAKPNKLHLIHELI